MTRTLGGVRSESEGVVLSEPAEAVVRCRAGDGVVPQVVEEAHGWGVGSGVEWSKRKQEMDSGYLMKVKR